MSEGVLNGAAEITRNEPAFGGLLFGEATPKAAKRDKYVLVGKLTGAVCQFTLTITESDQPALGALSSLLGGGVKTRSGLIVFAPDGKSATYAEISDRKIGKRENIRKTVG